jgi:DNA polymerase III delta subunit
MTNWYIVGHNDFLFDNAIQQIKERTCIDTLISKTDPEETYFFIKSCPKPSMLIVYGGGKHKLLDNLDRGGYHLIWHLDKKEQLPLIADKAHIFFARDLTEDSFVKFVETIFVENGITLSPDTIIKIVERLDKSDLYNAYNELYKLIQMVKSKALEEVPIGLIGNSKKFTVIDLFNNFMKKGDILPIISNLENQNIPAISINSFFMDSLCKMLIVKMYKDKKKELNDLQEKIGLHPYAIMKLKDQSGMVPLDTIISWHKRFCQLDVCLKYSGVNGYTLLKTNLMEITLGKQN